MQVLSFFFMNIGLIKGGQLGLMLIESGIKYADHFFVMDDDPRSPCRDFCKDVTIEDVNNPDLVEEFGKDLDALVVEFEAISTEGLRRLEDKGVRVFPSSTVLDVIQDKGLQKQFFEENGLPTAGYDLLEGKSDLEKHQDSFPHIIKLRRGGYDGKGVMKLDSIDDLPDQWDQPLVRENLVNIHKELAVVVCRDAQGNMASYPLVEMVFHEGQNMLDLLLSPAQVSEDHYQKAKDLAEKTAKALGIVGILAVEMFLTPDGEILINEVSPRLHNSGHVSIEAHRSSQFEQLMRIVHGFPLGSTEQLKPAAMLNLLGKDGHQGSTVYKGLEEVLKDPQVFVHLYRKEETRPFRKMGHVTVLGDSLEDCQQRARMVQNLLSVES